MKNSLFTGTCTALVTPFLDDRVNYPLMEQLLARQVEAGITAVVLSGTTGESATLSDEEKLTMFQRAKEFVGDSCTVIAGTGSNRTDHAVQLSMDAESAGADALLIVSPYYNKPTPEGLLRHYRAIAGAVSIPIIVYNVPSRTGTDIPESVYAQLSQIPKVAGVKEANPQIQKMIHIRESCPSDFSIWAGNDDLAVPAISLGARGLISVLSNICPEEVSAMVNAALDGDFDTAAALQLQLQPLYRLLFSETNPIPVKAAMKYVGFDCGQCRLPLSPLTKTTQDEMEAFFT